MSTDAAADPQAGTLYSNRLEPIIDGPPILADFPAFIEPLQPERRFLAPPVVDDDDADLSVRSWRYWYNARGIVEFENRLQGRATAIIVVHPWGIDDGHGMRTPEPAGCAFFCTVAKNTIGLEHMARAIDPFLRRVRPKVALVGYSMPRSEDPVRKLLYASIDTAPGELDPTEGEKQLAEALTAHRFEGEPLAPTLQLDPAHPARSYFEQAASTDAGDRYNGAGYWELPMPVAAPIHRDPRDLVFYDADGYPRVRDYLRGRGIRHVLLCGYCTDMCVIATTCGYANLSQDFNLFLVGDATLATFPGSDTPRFATQTALANAALAQMVTQVSWVR